MVDLSNYPLSTYDPSKPAAGVLAAVTFVSLIAWLSQSIYIKFKPIRLNILILISHITIFIHLVLRAALSPESQRTRVSFTVLSVFLAVGFRTVILSNYDYLVRVLGDKHKVSRAILIITFLFVMTSAILTAPAGSMSFDSDTIPQSFRLRRAAAALVLILTVCFYPTWFLTLKLKKNQKDGPPPMTKLAIILLVISSTCCLIISIYQVITSVDEYYIAVSHEEFWFYIFNMSPILLALYTWTTLHPLRSLDLGNNSTPRETENNHEMTFN